MGNAVVVEVKTQLPAASAVWTVDIGDDPKQSLIYGNLAYDLVAAAMAKLGVEFSKYLVDEDGDRLNSAMNDVQDTLRAGSVA
jgi:hypothetical protein